MRVQSPIFSSSGKGRSGRDTGDVGGGLLLGDWGLGVGYAFGVDAEEEGDMVWQTYCIP